MTSFQVMPALSDDELVELEADIAANGVLQPVLVDEHNRMIDGHNRKAIADRLGLRCPTIVCPPNLTDEQKRSLAYGVNLHRRHLTREQKRDLITSSLKTDPQLSDRQHAERAGASDKTVATVRDELESTAEIPQSDTRVSADGRIRPATQPATKPERPAPLTAAEQAEQDRADRITRRVTRLRDFVSGWTEFRTFRDCPERNDVLAALIPREREYVTEAEEAMGWTTTPQN